MRPESDIARVRGLIDLAGEARPWSNHATPLLSAPGPLA